MEPLKIFVVGPSVGYARPYGPKVIVDSMKEANVVLFTGGEDINPLLYECTPHETSWWSEQRDSFEVHMFKESLKHPNIKLRLGICRGAQLFCALSGGLLVQDVTNHCRTHTMVNKKGENFQISSCHHQMQFPYNLPKEDYEILYWSTNNISSHYFGDKIVWKPEYVEPEVVLYKKHNLLAIQGHPEMMSNVETLTMFNDLIQTLIK